MSVEIELNEVAKFIQHHLPGLEAGEYGVTLEQEFKGEKVEGTNDQGEKVEGTDKTDPLSYKFAVKGPRFRFNDPGEVHSVFPPPNAKGEFSNIIPHVVLKNETLPWIRVPTTTKNETDVDRTVFSAGNEKYDLDVPVWMAVLLLNAADFEDSGLTMEVQAGTIGDFFPSDGSFISPVTDSGETTDKLPPWEAPGNACQYLDIPIAVFKGIAPSLADLYMMGNVRDVEMINKAIEPDIEVPERGRYSIVLGNRIPALGERHLAVLVSLEHMQAYLPDWEGNPPTGIKSEVTHARLPVFYQWNFLSTGDTFAFEHLLESLNDRAPNGTPEVPGPLQRPELRLYPKATAKIDPTSPAQKAMSMGYVPLKHITRNGQTTASWYRGPLIPYALDSSNNTVHPRNSDGTNAIQSPDSLLRLNPDTGLFDTSYASAWQLGRLLALQDKSFSTTLYQWKRAMADSLIRLLEDNLIEDVFEDIVELGKDAGSDITEEESTPREDLYMAAFAKLCKICK